MLIKQGNKIAHWLIPTRNNVFIEKIKFYSEASALSNCNPVIKLYVKKLSMNIETS